MTNAYKHAYTHRSEDVGQRTKSTGKIRSYPSVSDSGAYHSGGASHGQISEMVESAWEDAACSVVEVVVVVVGGWLRERRERVCERELVSKREREREDAEVIA